MNSRVKVAEICNQFLPYPDESQDIRDHLVLRGFLKKTNQSQFRLELHKTIGGKRHEQREWFRAGISP